MMTIEGAGELNPVLRTAMLRRSPALAARPLAQIILSATDREARGARMHVGGLRVVDRAIRLLARVRNARVVIATDGSVRLPNRLPRNMERRVIEGDPASAINQLHGELGAEAIVVRADTVWVDPAGFDNATQVVDAASRRAAEELVFRDGQRETVGIIDRLLNQKIASQLTRLLFAHLPVLPEMLTLVAGFVGLYGALQVARASWQGVVTGFVILEGYVILSGCAAELARARFHETMFGAWLDTVVGDFINVMMILAVGVALWRHGGTYLDMKLALAASAMTVLYSFVSYRELMRQGEGDVMRLRWWFGYGQQLKNVTGPSSTSTKAIMLLGRRDFVIVLALALAYFDQLPVVLLYMMIVAMVRAVGALGQLFVPDWRTRPPV
jgi:hypothetical protein